MRSTPRPPIDSILTLMTVWSIWGKIIRIVIIVSYICTLWNVAVLTILGFGCFQILCLIKVKLCVKVKLLVSLLCVYAFCLERPSLKWPILNHLYVKWDVKPCSHTHCAAKCQPLTTSRAISHQQSPVFRGKFCQIPRASSQNSVTHRSKIVQIPRLTAAFRLCVN